MLDELAYIGYIGGTKLKRRPKAMMEDVKDYERLNEYREYFQAMGHYYHKLIEFKRAEKDLQVAEFCLAQARSNWREAGGKLEE